MTNESFKQNYTKLFKRLQKLISKLYRLYCICNVLEINQLTFFMNNFILIIFYQSHHLPTKTPLTFLQISTKKTLKISTILMMAS